MTFVPRLDPPSTLDKNWIQVRYGGKNPCINITNGSVLPNCVGYSFGRWIEILGYVPKLSTNDADKWYGNTKDGYERGKTPRLGAVICFYNTRPNKAGHIAIVEKINGNTITVSESEYGGRRFHIRELTGPDYRYTDHHTFQGFIYNPAVDNNTATTVPTTTGTGTTSGPLYTTRNDRNDATIRQFGYLDSSNKPSIYTTSIPLSVINYTSMLSDIFQAAGVGTSNSSTAILDALESSPRQCVQYLTGKGLNTAASIGIIANIKYESGFNPASRGDYQNEVPTSFGICQWHLGRADRMKSMAGPNWDTNLSGQLDYLWYELNNGYKSTLAGLQGVSNNVTGAKTAADIFVRKFEIPANVDRQSELRQKQAVEYWNMIAIQLI